ncbi:uncharacterized protein DDB_G0286175-like [Octopus sinensis]|uniref:Uncharacterized protein DDB_G0286175-like n=1 Tax=Octopus sinensis TaxID=2607531 RepID=A0A6P7SYQ4_9MOLL|nr:uncharacterized protein DDB_G0286175-like [Octopus sinensis]
MVSPIVLIHHFLSLRELLKFLTPQASSLSSSQQERRVEEVLTMKPSSDRHLLLHNTADVVVIRISSNSISNNGIWKDNSTNNNSSSGNNNDCQNNSQNHHRSIIVHCHCYGNKLSQRKTAISLPSLIRSNASNDNSETNHSGVTKVVKTKENTFPLSKSVFDRISVFNEYGSLEKTEASTAWN